MSRELLRSHAHRAVNVLIADDDAAMRRILTALIRRGGMQVVAQAENGLEAVRFSDEQRPDVVILDISMPLLDGFGAGRQIAELFPSTKIIFVSSHTCADYVREALHIGLGFIFKNYVVQHLRDAVDAALEGKRYLGAQATASVPAICAWRRVNNSNPGRCRQNDSYFRHHNL